MRLCSPESQSQRFHVPYVKAASPISCIWQQTLSKEDNKVKEKRTKHTINLPHMTIPPEPPFQPTGPRRRPRAGVALLPGPQLLRPLEHLGLLPSLGDARVESRAAVAGDGPRRLGRRSVTRHGVNAGRVQRRVVDEPQLRPDGETPHAREEGSRRWRHFRYGADCRVCVSGKVETLGLVFLDGIAAEHWEVCLRGGKNGCLEQANFRYPDEILKLLCREPSYQLASYNYCTRYAAKQLQPLHWIQPCKFSDWLRLQTSPQ